MRLVPRVLQCALAVVSAAACSGCAVLFGPASTSTTATSTTTSTIPVAACALPSGTWLATTAGGLIDVELEQTQTALGVAVGGAGAVATSVGTPPTQAVSVMPVTVTGTVVGPNLSMELHGAGGFEETFAGTGSCATLNLTTTDANGTALDQFVSSDTAGVNQALYRLQLEAYDANVAAGGEVCAGGVPCPAPSPPAS